MFFYGNWGGYVPMIVKMAGDRMTERKSNEIIVIGKMDHTLDNTLESANRVYSKNGICPTIPTCAGGNIQPKIIDDVDELKTIVVMRGRNPVNPSDRTAGVQTEQRLEPNGQGVCNTLTSVQKDNLVLEAKPKCINLYDEQGKETAFQDRVYKTDKISVAITTSFRPSYEIEKYRIRKLTPKECFRLMAVTDEDADKMLSINSNSQCYKQAGNSIVVSVLEALFRNLNIKGVKTCNEVKDNYDFYKKAEIMK